MNIVHLSRSDRTVDAIIRATFPEYTGRRVWANITEKIQFHGTMWDEGNRRSYRFLSLSTMQTATIPTEPFLQQSPVHDHYHTIPSGLVCVVMCEGRYDHIEIHGPACNVTPLLPAPVELTEHEQIVLTCTRSYKSSYAGIKDYRRHQSGLTVAQWDTAKTSLIGKKLLAKNGAITVEGRNAVK